MRGGGVGEVSEYVLCLWFGVEWEWTEGRG